MTERTISAAKSIEHRLRQIQQKKYFDLASFFGRPNADLKMFDGDILLLVGGSGSNKTTMIQNMINTLTEPTLYVSPEVYDHLFYRRQLQIITGLSKHIVLSNYKYLFEEYHKQLDLIHLVCKGLNEITLQETLADLSMTMGIKNIVLDHMKLMDLQGDFTRRAEEFVAWLKPFVSTRGIKVFMVSQVPKSAMMPNFSTGKTRNLEIYDAAGASGLYQIADIAMTINAPTGINEPVRYVSFGKARDGEAYKVTGVPLKLDVESMRLIPLNPEEESQLRQERVERINEKII